MKKIWLISFLLLGCATGPAKKHSDYRSPDSENYSCRFKSEVSGNELEFEFIPEENQLLIKSSGGTSSLDLVESDFSEGGFVFKNNTSPWDMTLVFTSFKATPHVAITAKKSPWSKSPISIDAFCKKSAD